MKDVKVFTPAGTFGFSFRMRANGVGGTFPKTYAVDNSNKLLTGSTNEFANPGFNAGWPSDPGDDTTPFLSRDYGPNAPPGITADNLCPNNVRLSQVPLVSIVSSFGIGPGLVQRNLPTSTNYDDGNLSTVPTPGQVFTLDNLCGLKKVRLQILDPLAIVLPDQPALVLVNGGYLLNGNFMNAIEMEISNLGAIAIVNLSLVDVTVGVTAEMNL